MSFILRLQQLAPAGEDPDARLAATRFGDDTPSMHSCESNLSVLLCE